MVTLADVLQHRAGIVRADELLVCLVGNPVPELPDHTLDAAHGNLEEGVPER